MTLQTTVLTRLHAVGRFAKLERVLAGVCVFVPLLLIFFDKEPFDDGRIRDSISHYYNMEQNQMYYFPLTMASMLFVVNGVIKKKKIYNTLLGSLLAVVILFNREDFSTLHNTFAFAFFAGNAVVILLFSSRKERWFKALLVAAIALSMAGYFIFDWFTLFWAESLSFAIIAFHYILESWGVID